MKNNKFWFFIFTMLIGFGINAQEVDHEGTTYYIKGKSILKDGKDITDTLDATLQEEILLKLDNKMKLQKEADQKEKELKKLDWRAEKAEKKLKKAQKELKKKEKAQKKYEKSTKKLESAQKKYARLKRKGKLSPNDEEDWLKKIEDLKDDVDKYEKKLKKS